MKIFQFIQMPLERLGLHPPGSKEFHSSYWKRLLVLSILIHFSLTTLTFLLYEAQTYREYAESFYIFVTASLKIGTFSVTLRKISTLFKLLADYQKTIENRKFISLFRSIEIFKKKRIKS